MKCVLFLLYVLMSCGMAFLQEEVVRQYGAVIHATYADALKEAKVLDELIGKFVDDPTEDKLREVKKQWIQARFPYSQSEVSRFYGGPIDDENGFEGWINAWPIDEAYLDYVKGKPQAGIINKTDEVRGIDEEVLFELNEQGGEADICTGYHALEFLIWGQDFYEDSPGKRPLSDYTTSETARRRRDALRSCSRLLVTHLSTLEADWSAGQSNYRQRFVDAPSGQSLSKILTGMSMLSGFELASERLAVAYDTQSQEDEHSCFSDTTHFDLIYNIKGIRNVWRGEYRAVGGAGIQKLAAASQPELAKKISENLENCLKLAAAIPVPFDQAILGDDDEPGRAKILKCIESLEALNQKLLLLAKRLGVNEE
ncbi:hypothetical protein N9Y81_02910 [Akkermansiaceae bacterium]|jgi:putative iron-regulated protein|nr:hypothetical protein [Akkermansiaceae bacterium]